MTAARKFHHAWRVSERAVPSAYKPSSSPSLRTEFALTAIITCPLKTNYSTSFLVVLRLSPLAPPPSFSRSPIIISTRMTRPPLLVHLSSNRLARLLPSLMHPTGRYTASPIFIIQRSIFSSKGLPTESCIYNLLFQFLLYCFVWRNFVENRYLPPLRIIFIYFHLNNVT